MLIRWLKEVWLHDTDPKTDSSFLIPSPQMTDERFMDAVIYICRHTKDGAWGFIINQSLPIA